MLFLSIVHHMSEIILFLNLQDSFGRLHERGKEVPKTTKALCKLFPNKVTVHMPQVLNG